MSESNKADWKEKQEKYSRDFAQGEKAVFVFNFFEQNRKSHPPDRLAKLAERTAEIARNQDIQKKDIQQECQKALEELRKEWTLWEKVMNYTGNIMTRTDTKNKPQSSSADSLHEKKLPKQTQTNTNFKNGTTSPFWAQIDSEEQNKKIKGTEEYLRKKLNLWKNPTSDAIKDTIKTLDPNKIKEITDYLLKKYENDKTCDLFFGFKSWIEQTDLIISLNQTYIEKQKNRLDATLTIFLKSKRKKETEIAEIIKEINTPNINQSCNTAILQQMINVLKKHWIKDINFDNKKELIDILTIKIDIYKKTTEWKLDEIFQNKWRPDLLAEIKKLSTETEIRVRLKNNGFEPTEIDEIVEELRKTKQVKKQEENVIVLKNTDKKEFNYLLTKLKNWSDPKDVMSDVKKMQEERLNPEKKEEVPERKSPSSRRMIANLEVGDETPFPLSRGGDSQSSDIAYVTRTGKDSYALKVARHEPVILTEKATEWYMKSFKFLENNGLGYLVRNIDPNRLSNIISLAGKNGNKVSNKDGDFKKDEQLNFLRTIWKVLEIENIQTTPSLSQAKETLNHTFYIEWSTLEGWFEKIAGSEKIGLIKDGILDVNEFEKRMK